MQSIFTNNDVDVCNTKHMRLFVRFFSCNIEKSESIESLVYGGPHFSSDEFLISLWYFMGPVKVI